MDFRVRTFYPILASAGLLIAGYALFIICVSSHEEGNYRELIEKANPFLLNQGNLGFEAQQSRQGVQKDMWYQKEENKRLQVSLNSAASALVLERHGEVNEIVEAMQGFTGFIQEDLYYDEEAKPMQHVRYIEAETARYNYHTQLLTAEGAKMIDYSTSGHDLIDSLEGVVEPRFNAVAESLEISGLTKECRVKAHRVRAVIEK
ncbi:MAG: hypothetical protein WB791_04255 [Waddliaceae bacterium]